MGKYCYVIIWNMGDFRYVYIRLVLFAICPSSIRTTKMDTKKISARWLILDIMSSSYVVQSQDKVLPPFTICLEEPMSDEKLKKIAACKDNLSKINEMPADVIVDLWKASVV